MPDLQQPDPILATLHRATDLAMAGRLTEGYQHLLAALADARGHGSPRQVRMWEMAVVRYASRFGVPLEAE
jgi:hypothetical protein